MKNFSVKHIVATGIGAALFFLLGRFISIVIFANTTLTFQYAVQAFFAVLFGPIVGALVGFIGHIIIDMTFPWGIWWSWIITSGFVGWGFGIISKGIPIEEGVFTGKHIARFVIGTTIVNAIGWIGLAPVLDILIYAQPVERVFAQGAVAFVTNAITTAVVGTLLLIAYAKAKPKSGSLSQE